MELVTWLERKQTILGKKLCIRLQNRIQEANELADAITAHDQVETVDALIDILVVTIGALHSIGADAEGAWKEVMKTNFAKIDRETGKVRKREDGKVLKPQGWTPPDLKPFLKKNATFNKFS